ncbi:MAG: hypothetical protein ACI4TV_00420, partial [Paludibacteraceae bacterium]
QAAQRPTRWLLRGTNPTTGYGYFLRHLACILRPSLLIGIYFANKNLLISSDLQFFGIYFANKNYT